MDLRAAVVDAVADHRPAVILALADDVDLVATAGTVLDLPEFTGGRIDREPLFVAVAVAPDFRPGIAAADKRIA